MKLNSFIKQNWGVITFVTAALLIHFGWELYSHYEPPPYLAKRLSIMVAEKVPDNIPEINVSDRSIYVWASYDVSACVWPRGSFCSDVVYMVRTPSGKIYDRVMVQEFNFPSHCSVEHFPSRVEDASEIPDFLQALLRNPK